MAAEGVRAVRPHPGGEGAAEQHRLGVRLPRWVLQQASTFGHLDGEHLLAKHLAIGQELDPADLPGFLQHPIVVNRMPTHRLR